MKKLMITLLKPLSFLPAILMMYVIYSFSAQTGEVSGQLSYKISYKIVETKNQLLNENKSSAELAVSADTIHFYVRKAGHMTEYFLLAVAISFPLYVYGVRGIWLVILAGIICVGFAGLDEYHQSFVADRGHFPAGCRDRQHRRIDWNPDGAGFLLVNPAQSPKKNIAQMQRCCIFTVPKGSVKIQHLFYFQDSGWHPGQSMSAFVLPVILQSFPVPALLAVLQFLPLHSDLSPDWLCLKWIF